MFWRSVVGKLWFTILLLVSFVLTILTVLLLQFFESFHIKEAEDDLTQLAQQISNVLWKQHENPVAFSIAWELVDPSSKVLIIDKEGKASYSPEPEQLIDIPLWYILDDPVLSQAVLYDKNVSKVLSFPNAFPNNNDDSNQIMVVGVPVKAEGPKHGAVFVYQSLDAIQETTKQTTRIILVSAAVAIILTTVFAFFLSTRITSPLRKMREAAFEMAKGKFDTKVPILTHDEIGELALAFNRMGRQLEFHITALNQEKEQLSGILSSMADGVITMSRNGEILLSNPPGNIFLHSFHYDQEYEANKDQRLPKQMMALLEQVVLQEKEQDFEISAAGRSWVILMTPLYGQSQVRGVVAVLRDMTEERKLNKLRKDFIANVSHELRTPISMLQGYSEAIVDDIASTDQEKREISQIIYDESLRMGRLVNELLDIARMEAGHIQLNKESVPIHDFIERIVRKFQGIAKDNQVSISLNSEIKTDLEFVIDPDRIEQVLTNLIDNAIRHTNEGGSVTVSIEQDQNGIEVFVEDSGSGIPEEDLPFVFERFYKADKARTRGRSGTGLGLAIAKNIIIAHNGHIHVNSKVDEGTTFVFFLPYA